MFRSFTDHYLQNNDNVTAIKPGFKARFDCGKVKNVKIIKIGHKTLESGRMCAALARHIVRQWLLLNCSHNKARI